MRTPATIQVGGLADLDPDPISCTMEGRYQERSAGPQREFGGSGGRVRRASEEIDEDPILKLLVVLIGEHPEGTPSAEQSDDRGERILLVLHSDPDPPSDRLEDPLIPLVLIPPRDAERVPSARAGEQSRGEFPVSEVSADPDHPPPAGERVLDEGLEPLETLELHFGEGALDPPPLEDEKFTHLRGESRQIRTSDPPQGQFRPGRIERRCEVFPRPLSRRG